MKITVYEKTESHCGACTAMMNVYDKWTEDQGEVFPGYVSYSAEENADLIHEMGFQQAPVWIIDPQDGSKPRAISGNKQKELREALDDAIIDIWE